MAETKNGQWRLRARPVGMVTESDFLRVAHRVLGGDLMSVEDRTD